MTDFKMMKLTEVCRVYQPETISKKSLPSNGIYPVYGANGKIGYNDKFNHEEPQLLLGCRGSVGSIHISEAFSWINGNAMVVQPFEYLVTRDYLKYALLGGVNIKEAISGTAQPQITRESLSKINIPIPSLEKQVEIVKKLDSTFAEIDLLEKNISEKNSALNEISAGKLDRIFSGKNESFRDSRQIKLSEIARVINGRAYSQPELLKQGPYPVLRVGNFFSNRGWYYSDLELDKDKYCDNGDLLYAWSASFGPRIWDGGKVIYHYHIWKIEEVKEIVLRDWLYWWFLWDVKQIKEAHGTGSTMMHVTKGAMENRLVQLPSLEMQSQQVREIAELQLATQKIESNYNDLAKKLFELKNAVLTSSFEEAVA